MAIIRTHLDFETEFTRLPNEWVRDGQLSLKARGLLAVLMSHRPGWRIAKASLVAGGPEGREAIEGALRELRNAGYLKVAPSRDESTGRMQGQDWVICVPDRVTGNPSFGGSAPKKTKVKEDQEFKNVKLDFPIERVHGNKPATAKQVRFLRDCHLMLHMENPPAAVMTGYRAMTSAEAHEEIRALWAEIEAGGNGLFAEARDEFGVELSPQAHALIEERLAG